MDFLSDVEIWKQIAAILTAVVGGLGSYFAGRRTSTDARHSRTHQSLNTALDRQMARITALETQIEERDAIIARLQKRLIDVQINQ